MTPQTPQAPAGKRSTSRVTPLPRSLREARPAGVVVFGGSFDPPHRWHTAVARSARQRAERELKQSGASGPVWLLFIPAARSPHKDRGPVAPDADRVEMVRRATARLARAAVWTDEIDRASPSAPSYTVDTLRRLRKLLPRSTRVWLLIGADQAEKFHLWRDHHAIMALADPLVVLRPPVRSAATLARRMRAAGAWSDDQLAEWARRIVPARIQALSSTAARSAARRAHARGSRALRAQVAPAVAAWIKSRALYSEPAPASRRARPTPPS